MSDPNGWPDPSRPGVPLNPELPGAHAVKDTGGTVAVMLWRDPWWKPSRGWAMKPPEMAAARWRYLGPCLTPDQITARVEQARNKALEEAAAVARRVEIPGECSPAEAHGRMTGALAAAEAIRALKEAPHG